MSMFLVPGGKRHRDPIPMGIIEELGLLKMDFLGLRNLTVIRDALEMIEANHGVRIDFSKMEFDDAKVYELISSGNTLGVFQLESSGMLQFMMNLRPDCFEDIVAGISLYRPGPMASIPTYIENKKNPQNIKYIHKCLEPILSVTYGCMVSGTGHADSAGLADILMVERPLPGNEQEKGCNGAGKAVLYIRKGR